MIVPFLPQSIRGAIWYQGESNVGAAPLYACLEPLMIEDWRSKFGSGYSFPFLYVIIGPWIADVSGSIPVADLRVAQMSALSLPGVGYASAFDLGDPDSPFTSIHPRNKQAVGARLVNAARNLIYGEQDLSWMGPFFHTATQSQKDRTVTILVTFSTYGTDGLYYQDNSCPDGVHSDLCANWEVQLEDGKWHAATKAESATNSNTVTITFDIPLFSKGPVIGIRYAYSIWPVATLYSAEGLPAIPFEYFFSS
eukprot:Phypoly_transcript_15832.p1 GENE.Phypoly_transcript_15832~~Phypoly_transcript_15832.p1  ORF type:complete len:252 (+),score=21.24 Phypoly_transcript_15832:101-856(+)